MKKRMVRITGCLLAGALSIGSFGLNTYAAPVAGVSSVTAVEIAEGQTPAAGVSQALARCLADSNDAAAQKAAEQAEQVSENDTPVVASEYTDIAIAQVDNYVNVRNQIRTARYLESCITIPQEQSLKQLTMVGIVSSPVMLTDM